MTDRPSSAADVTPVDPSAAPALRREIEDAKAEITGMHTIAALIRENQARVLDELTSIQASIGPLLDQSATLDLTIARIVGAEGQKLRAGIKRDSEQAIAKSEKGQAEKLRIAINAAALLAKRDMLALEKRVAMRVEAVDHRVDELSLHTGAGLHQAETALAKITKPVGYSAGGAGLIYAAMQI